MFNGTKKFAKIWEKFIFALMGLVTILALAPPLFFVFIIVSRGIGTINWTFLTALPLQGMTAGGIFPAIAGTFFLMVGTILFALPLGVLSALYLTEYAKKGPLVRLINLAIINMAGVPSIVYGLFGLGLFVLFLGFGSSLLAGSLTLASLILPLIITTSVEAFKAVPQSFRQASLALGASKLQTIRRVVLPNALPGIITGIVLGIGRAAGETAPIMFTVAAFYLSTLPRSPFDEVMALPYHLYVIATQVPHAPRGIMWGTALVLLTLVLSFTVIAAIIRGYYRKAKKW